MSRKGTERRRRIFEELYASGQLQRPLYRRKPRPQKEVKTVPVVDNRCYCLKRFGNSIPNDFRRCIDCLDNGADRV